jgi:hypothetical protein
VDILEPLRQDYLFTCPIKRAGEAMDEDTMAFAMTHPSVLRRLLFGLQEGHPEDVRQKCGFNGGGYGRPCNVKGSDAADYGLVVNSDGDLMDRFESREFCLKWTIDQIKALGVEIED